MSGFIVVIFFYLLLFDFLLFKALWITILYEMCYMNNLALPKFDINIIWERGHYINFSEFFILFFYRKMYIFIIN